MSTTETVFDRLQSTMQQGGVAETLELLIGQLREQGQLHELFEALKMHVRHQIGLPLMYSDSGDNLTAEQRRQLEDGLLDACREVGLALLRQGSVREGWMYLRPVGEPEAAAAALREVEVDEDNLEDVVQVCLQEGVDVEHGFRLVLEFQGTCNAITTFEHAMPHLRREDQRKAARQLLRHLHGELLESVQGDVAQQSGSRPTEQTLRELVADRDWLFTENAYHVDTTHLASVVRYSRLLDSPADLRLALDLTEYGRRLHGQFQYENPPPFEPLYPSYARFLGAQLGENVDDSLAYFREQAETTSMDEHGFAAVDAYVDLLARLARYREAIDELTRLLPPTEGRLEVMNSTGWAPSLLELSEKAGDYESLVEYSRSRGDLLGFVAGLTQAQRGDG